MCSCNYLLNILRIFRFEEGKLILLLVCCTLGITHVYGSSARGSRNHKLMTIWRARSKHTSLVYPITEWSLPRKEWASCLEDASLESRLQFLPMSTMQGGGGLLFQRLQIEDEEVVHLDTRRSLIVATERSVLTHGLYEIWGEGDSPREVLEQAMEYFRRRSVQETIPHTADDNDDDLLRPLLYSDVNVAVGVLGQPWLSKEVLSSEYIAPYDPLWAAVRENLLLGGGGAAAASPKRSCSAWSSDVTVTNTTDKDTASESLVDVCQYSLLDKNSMSPPHRASSSLQLRIYSDPTSGYTILCRQLASGMAAPLNSGEGGRDPLPLVDSERRPQSGVLGPFSLRNLRFKTPTAMEPELGFLMCNFARIRPGSVVLDPFCGSCSILMAAAYQQQEIYQQQQQRAKKQKRTVRSAEEVRQKKSAATTTSNLWKLEKEKEENKEEKKSTTFIGDHHSPSNSAPAGEEPAEKRRRRRRISENDVFTGGGLLVGRDANAEALNRSGIEDNFNRLGLSYEGSLFLQCGYAEELLLSSNATATLATSSPGANSSTDAVTDIDDGVSVSCLPDGFLKAFRAACGNNATVTVNGATTTGAAGIANGVFDAIVTDPPYDMTEAVLRMHGKAAGGSRREDKTRGEEERVRDDHMNNNRSNNSSSRSTNTTIFEKSDDSNANDSDDRDADEELVQKSSVTAVRDVISTLLSVASRWLKPGGRLVFFAPSRHAATYPKTIGFKPGEIPTTKDSLSLLTGAESVSSNDSGTTAATPDDDSTISTLSTTIPLPLPDAGGVALAVAGTTTVQNDDEGSGGSRSSAGVVGVVGVESSGKNAKRKSFKNERKRMQQRLAFQRQVQQVVQMTGGDVRSGSMPISGYDVSESTSSTGTTISMCTTTTTSTSSSSTSSTAPSSKIIDINDQQQQQQQQQQQEQQHQSSLVQQQQEKAELLVSLGVVLRPPAAAAGGSSSSSSSAIHITSSSSSDFDHDLKFVDAHRQMLSPTFSRWLCIFEKKKDDDDEADNAVIDDDEADD